MNGIRPRKDLQIQKVLLSIFIAAQVQPLGSRLRASSRVYGGYRGTVETTLRYLLAAWLYNLKDAFCAMPREQIFSHLPLIMRTTRATATTPDYLPTY